jgi:uncharacterized protein YndB with AHSA1/START domain
MISQSSVVHSTFTIERTYEASPARVFAAFADVPTKRRWFVEGEGWEIDAYTMDFRVGGLERGRFRFQDGPEIQMIRSIRTSCRTSGSYLPTP